MQTLSINGAPRVVDVAPETPLLWVLRDNLNLVGTKFGCGVAACGACTVTVDGVAQRSCVLPVSAIQGRRVRTIEGLGGHDGAPLHALQEAWIAHSVPQCGYCQSGMLMSAAALLAAKPAPTDADIDQAMTNVCRCGTYQRIRSAIHSAAKELAAKPATSAALGADAMKMPIQQVSAGSATVTFTTPATPAKSGGAS